jgi:hypothetical protein
VRRRGFFENGAAQRLLVRPLRPPRVTQRVSLNPGTERRGAVCVFHSLAHTTCERMRRGRDVFTVAEGAGMEWNGRGRCGSVSPVSTTRTEPSRRSAGAPRGTAAGASPQ